MKKNEYYTTEKALIEQENAVLAELETEYGPEDLGPTDTESNLLGRIKSDFTVYNKMRSQRRCKADLLEKLHTQICLYRLLARNCYNGPLLSFANLTTARVALREPKAC
jgi:hypothetical protein